MDFYPFWNSLRIASISAVIVFFLGIFLAYFISKLPRWAKGIIDVIFTLPMVLPPTVCGYLLLVAFGRNQPLGQFLSKMGISFIMTWYGGILASVFVAFPLMYRTVRASFESFNKDLANAGKTLGLSNWFVFWRIRIPACQSGIIAGIVLSFARALGEYGATSMLIGYIPTKTATISTTVYHYWQINDEKTAWIWVAINIALSAVMLLSVNLIENRDKGGKKI